MSWVIMHNFLEPTDAYVWWTLMHHFLFICLSICYWSKSHQVEFISLRYLIISNRNCLTQVLNIVKLTKHNMNGIMPPFDCLNESYFLISGEKLKLPARSNSFRSEKSSTSSGGDAEKKPLSDSKSPKSSKKHTQLKVL